MVKSKQIVGVALILAAVLFFSLLAFGLVPEYVLGKSGAGGQTLTDLKTQKPTTTLPVVSPDTNVPKTPTVTPNPATGDGVSTPVVATPPQTVPVQTPPRRVTRAS